MTTTEGLIYKGLGTDEKRLLTEGQTCAICDANDVQLVVDHCHTTGLVRGVVCGRCNLKLGWVDALTVDWVTRAGRYLGDRFAPRQLLSVVRESYETKHQEWIAELRKLEAQRAELYRSIEQNQLRMSRIQSRII